MDLGCVMGFCRWVLTLFLVRRIVRGLVLGFWKCRSRRIREIEMRPLNDGHYGENSLRMAARVAVLTFTRSWYAGATDTWVNNDNSLSYADAWNISLPDRHSVLSGYQTPTLQQQQTQRHAHYKVLSYLQAFMLLCLGISTITSQR